MIEINRMNENDIEDICEIEKLSLETAWGRDALIKELTNKNGIYFTAREENKTVGYIGMWNISGEGNITNIAVHPNFRGKGIGDMLIKKIIDYSKENKLNFLTLEVSEKNEIAYRLYEKNGFFVVGRRKRYYDNKYDAILMNYEF